MTDAAFPHSRPVRRLAVVGALGLVLTPVSAATSFAAPGTVSVLQPGAESESAQGNQALVSGCSFMLGLDESDAGTYLITFTSQNQNRPIPEVQGAATVTIGEDQAAVRTSYLFFDDEDAIEATAQGFRVTAHVANAEDEADTASRNFWVRDCDPAPRPATPKEPAPNPPAPEAATAAPAPDKPAAEQPASDGPEQEAPAPMAAGADELVQETSARHVEDAPEPTEEASVPAVVNSGINSGNSGLVALGLGGAAVASLAALGVRRSTRG